MSIQEGPFVFRVNENGSGPNLLIQVCLERGWKKFVYDSPFSNAWNLWWKTQGFPISQQKPLLSWQVCMERGWREYTESNPIKDGWNLWWKTSAFSVSQHKHLKAWQFTNHIPKGAAICRKDNLARNLKCMKKVYGAIYDISPHGYNLPLEYTKLVADCSRHENEDESQKVWICKPVGQSQGRGIFLFKNLSDLCYDSNAVVQRYIKNPLLIGGYKFDLRLYVCVPSYHPLTIYLYREGLVRFSTDKFSLADLNNPFCHLTNSSLNKLGPGYSEQKDRIGAGCKWSFRQLRQYFQQSGIRDWLLWQRVSALVTLTILSQSTSVPQTTNCFEFYGFDVLIDEKLKPWLLEVNLSPALGNDCDIDPVVKKPLLHDLFDLLGLPVCNTGLSLFSLFSPFLDESDIPPCSHFDEDGNKSEDKQICQVKPKLKSALNVQTYRTISRTGSGTETALLVANAATKWRKKRRSGYLFGPPVRDSLEIEKLKPEKLEMRSSLPSSSLLNSIEPTKPKEPSKEQLKIEENKELEKNKECLTLEIKDIKQGRRSASNGKRSREKEDKLKFCNSAMEIQNRPKTISTVPKTNSSSDGSKKINKYEIDLKSKKKKKDLAADLKSSKSRFESKNNYVYDKQKKLYPLQTDAGRKAMMLRIDKSATAVKGFRGRTKPQTPILWGNGRDWNNPIHSEGDWGRIYPLTTFHSRYNSTFEEDSTGNKFSVGDKQIRLVVHHITNFIKISKQIYCKGADASEEELSAQLINHLGLTGDVWLPSK